jgi:hypothetical protein
MLVGSVPPRPGSGGAHAGESGAMARAMAGSCGKGETSVCASPLVKSMAYLYPSSPPSALLLLSTLHSRRGTVNEVSSTVGAVVVFPGLPLRPPVDLRPGGATLSWGYGEAVFFIVGAEGSPDTN